MQDPDSTLAVLAFLTLTVATVIVIGHRLAEIRERKEKTAVSLTMTAPLTVP